MSTDKQIIEESSMDDVWYFAKQDTSFDNAFKAISIFEETPEGDLPTNYYKRVAEETGVTSNIRILSVAQLMGLLSKTTPFEKEHYDLEKATSVYNELARYSIGSAEYNAIKTEQLLKIRMKAITDTRNIDNYGVYPFIIIAEILWKLSLKGVTRIPRDAFYQYVMTLKRHEDIDSCVEKLSQDEKISVDGEMVKRFMSNSRVETIIKNNMRLFHIDDKYVSIDKDFAEYYTIFFNGPYKGIVSLLYSIVDDVEKYQEILTKNIGISLNFIDSPQIRPDGNPLVMIKPSTEVMNCSTLHYLTAIRTKPFILLAGISGTGKSQIVRKLAQASINLKQEDESSRWTNQHPKNFELVQVKPNWHNSMDVVGYKSNIGREHYEFTPFVEFIAKACLNKNVPYFLCLDEMNLAPVEEYFAEFLSAIESRSIDKDGNYTTDPIIKPFTSFDGNDNKMSDSMIAHLLGKLDSEVKLYLAETFRTKGLMLPQNLIVMGTVNMDETTFSFSRKVLDRAMSIEMNEVNFEKFLSGSSENVVPVFKECDRELIVNRPIKAKSIKEKLDIKARDIINYLTDINKLFEGTPFKLGYRSANEALLYVSSSQDFGNDNIAKALDEFSLMKILSRIEGDENKLAVEPNDDRITDIGGLIKTVDKYGQTNLLSLLQAVIVKHLGNVDNWESVKKLDEMLDILHREHFVSYWG